MERAALKTYKTAQLKDGRWPVSYTHLDVYKRQAPGSAAVTSGCPYRPRCPLAEAECALSRPELVEIRPGHRVACHVAKRDASVPAAEQA